jgi:pyridoxal phosphate enzyme (YggS family)
VNAADLVRRLVAVGDRVGAAAERVNRVPSEITTVVISKGRSIESIAALYDAGHRDFGENRAQELAGKVPVLPSDIRWHFVGPLQTNKVRIVRPTASLLHSYDRIDLGRAWMKGPGNPPPVLLQVNVGGEEQKHGWAVDDVPAALERSVALGVEVRGLMAIPPLTSAAERSRPMFARLFQLRELARADHPQVVELSMGMSDDFEIAIEEGATIIRPGRAIFEA